MLADQSTFAMSIANIISACCYCDPVTFMIKMISRSYLDFVLDVLHMYKKLKKYSFQCNWSHIKIHVKSIGIIEIMCLH
jgi:hypothetical protein